MKKVKGLTKRLAAMFLSGLLVVGAVPGTVLASESPEDLGQTAETAAEDIGNTSEVSAEEMGDTLSEEVSAEGFCEDAALQGEEAAEEYYTVTLDANGGYFENEWDDAIGEIVEQAQVISKQVPAYGTVAAAPVFTEMDQDGKVMVFAGWSLEPDGDLVTTGNEEYAPVDSRTLYAVWEAEDPSAGDNGSDIESQDIAEENTDQIDASQDSVDVDEAAEGSAIGQDSVEADEAAEGSQDVRDSVEVDETTEGSQDAQDSVEADKTAEGSQDAQDSVEVDETAEGSQDVQGSVEAGDAAAGDTLAEDAVAGDTLAEDAAAEDASTEDTAAEDAVSENLLISEGETETTEEESANTDMAGTIIDSGECGFGGVVTWTLDEEGKLIIVGQGEMQDYQDGGAPWYNYKDSLYTVIIESGVTSIGSYAFSGCSSLTGIEIPDGIRSIFDHAFSGCTSLTSIKLPEGLTYTGIGVFSDCSNLTSVELPNSLESINSYMFSGCSSLTNIKLPEGLDGIGAYMFSGCSSLTNIEIPDGIEYIFDHAFSDCSSLTSIEIPDGIKNIFDHAFSGCSSLTSIELPESIDYISDGVFSGCSSLTSIKLPERLGGIGAYAFSGCTSLSSVELPENLGSCYEYAFSGCSSLTSIVLPEGLVYIDPYVFSDCSNLERITLPSSLRKLDPTALSGCSSLTEVIYGGTEEAWNKIDFRGNQFIFNGMTLTFLGKKSLEFVEVTGLSDATYTGEAITQSPVVEYNGTTLIEGTDYTVSYENNIDHGEAGVIITGQGDYVGTLPVSFWINKAAQTITASNMSLTYLETGTITVSGNKGELSYTSSNTDIATVDSTGKVTAKGIGTATITISAGETDNYEAAAPKAITVTVSKAAQTITASNLSLTFPNSGKITASGNQGNLSYKSSNTAIATVDSTGKVTAKGAGKAAITITAAATSNYNAATKQITVTVARAAQSITAKAAASSIAVGKTTTVSITGAKGTKSFKSSDTTVAAVNASTGLVTAKKVGTVKITATSAATAQYNAASKTVTIKVVPAATSSLTAANQATGIKLTWKKVTGANGYKVYRGSTLIKTITSGSTVTYADTKANTNGTKYTYKVVAKASTGDSTLSKSVAVYRVARPAVSSVTNSAASKMTVKWGKNAKANGYQIQYSTDKAFKSGNKAVTVTGASTVYKVIGSLTKGKTYYVRIRTYKTVGSAKYWSVWSSARSVKISK